MIYIGDKCRTDSVYKTYRKSKPEQMNPIRENSTRSNSTDDYEQQHRSRINCIIPWNVLVLLIIKRD